MTANDFFVQDEITQKPITLLPPQQSNGYHLYVSPHCEGAAAVVGGYVTHGRRKLRYDGPCWVVVCASQKGINTPPTKT